ncbi:MAG: alpha/beta hydrolase [Kiritimatiellia bacterium]
MKQDDPQIPLWNAPVPGDFQPTLQPYVLEGAEPRPFLLVIPGGGYCARMDSYEGEDICTHFNKLGLHAGLLRYRFHPQAHFPEPMRDLARAIRMVRAHAKDWNVDSKRIGVCGFSAGGHLAAWGSVKGDTVDSLAGDDADAFSPIPDFTVLAYPVINGLDHPHVGSFVNLIGAEHPTHEQLFNMSADRFVTPETPPVFIWCTAEDRTVPWQNTAAYATACLTAGVQTSLHIFPYGGHGLHLGPGTQDISTWPALAATFIKTFRTAP